MPVYSIIIESATKTPPCVCLLCLLYTYFFGFPTGAGDRRRAKHKQTFTSTTCRYAKFTTTAHLLRKLAVVLRLLLVEPHLATRPTDRRKIIKQKVHARGGVTEKKGGGGRQKRRRVAQNGTMSPKAGSTAPVSFQLRTAGS